MSTLDWVIGSRLVPSPRRLGLLAVMALVLLSPRSSRAQAQPEGRPDLSPTRRGKPDPLREDRPDLPVLHTILLPRDRQIFHHQMVDASLPPRDEPGIRVLDFTYKPLRILTVDIPGKGRRRIHYLYYKVANRTGAPRTFAPRFIMVNDKGEEFEDEVVPRAIPPIQRREEPAIAVLGRDHVTGILPPSTRPDADDAVYGVATWEKWDDKADRFSIHVRGLSDGHKEVPSPNRGKASVKHRTLRIDFIREREIQLADPPHEWSYR